MFVSLFCAHYCRVSQFFVVSLLFLVFWFCLHVQIYLFVVVLVWFVVLCCVVLCFVLVCQRTPKDV